MSRCLAILYTFTLINCTGNVNIKYVNNLALCVLTIVDHLIKEELLITVCVCVCVSENVSGYPIITQAWFALST